MTLERLIGESAQDHKFRILLGKAKGDIDASWGEIEKALNLGLNHTTIRVGSIFLPEYEAYLQMKNEDTEEIKSLKYKETTEVKADGSTSSDRLIAMNEEESKDASFLIKAHGFNPDEFELVNAKSSMWHTMSKDSKTMYSSKITVKPKKNGFDYEGFIKKLQEGTTKAIPYEKAKLELAEQMLVIPLFDMHFGIADLEYYKETMMKIDAQITSKRWSKIVFIIGQDAFHNDNFKGTTTSGTIIDKVDTAQAWEDAFTFYKHLINLASAHSDDVQCTFSSGNHDETVGWCFVKTLEVYFRDFKNISFDSTMAPRKAITWKNVFIGTAHTDKGSNRIIQGFMAEFGKQIAQANIVEILGGHVHHEKSLDSYGVVVRNLAARAKTDG